jgi:hypothetical protein
MRVLLLLIFFVTIGVLSVQGEAHAQAGTGGTNDGPAASGMVYPMRPRVGPAVSQPVPNAYQWYPPQQPQIRLRRVRPVSPNPVRTK